MSFLRKQESMLLFSYLDSRFRGNDRMNGNNKKYGFVRVSKNKTIF